MKIVVVGSGIAGVRVSEELRRGGHTGPIVLLGGETYPPYDRPPLSKEVLRGTRSAAAVRLRDDRFFADHEVTLRLGTSAASVDPVRRSVVLSDGDEVDYDKLIVATGLTPRTLPGAAGHSNVHVLRSLDDCFAVRKSLDHATSALVVGAGFIGCETASTLRGMGVEVCLVEPQAAPLSQVLGGEVGELVARWHRDAGVDLRCRTGLTALVGESKCEGAALSDGTEVKADLVITGIGSAPSTRWLAGSGIDLDDGVLCDRRGRTSVQDVWAIGDVASWQGSDGRAHRLEHWTNSGEQARVVARDLLGLAEEDPAVPYFWSDQYGLKLQVFGEFVPGGEIAVVEDDGRRFVATCNTGGVLTGVAGAGKAGKIARLRRSLGEPAR